MTGREIAEDDRRPEQRPRDREGYEKVSKRSNGGAPTGGKAYESGGNLWRVRRAPMKSAKK